MKTETCRKCGKSFEFEPVDFFAGRPLFQPKYCSPCVEIMSAERQIEIEAQYVAERKQRIESEWARICPPLYNDTDVSLLPANAHNRVMAWKYGPTGLILHGETGRCKTRSMYQLLKRLHFEDKKKIQVFNAVSFSHEVNRRFFDGTGEEWIARLCQVDVVFMDDLGKCRLTERGEAELFGLIEQRTANLKPILATTNFIGESLSEKLTDDRGLPLVRRLREFCQAVSF